MASTIIQPRYDHYIGLPDKKLLFNPLTDVPIHLSEESELIEFYKLTNEFFSPEFGIKYLFNTNLFPFQMSTIRALLMHKFPMLLFTRGGGKTFLLAVFALLYAYLFPGSKIVLVSASFRQSKHIFDAIKIIFGNSPLLRLLSDREPVISTDRCYYGLNGSTIVALPLGQGDKIRGERGHIILVDEFDSVSPEVFDIVIRGFAATESDPWEKNRGLALDRKYGKKDQVINALVSSGNKIVLSGTAGYKNGTLYRAYRHYITIIKNQIAGFAKDYSEVLGSDFEEEQEVNFRDYCVIKYNYLQIPKGMMETDIIASARAQMPKVLFNMEYMCDFADDSAGFFKARDIVEATASFPILTKGNSNKSYIMGVDPARTTDRFAIVLIEEGGPNRIRYVWTCQDQKYSYGAKKMRSLMRQFNVSAIAMDAGGGGHAVEELLNTEDVLKETGGDKIYRFEDEENNGGKKILHMINFTSQWIDEANSALQKNIEDKFLLFPAMTRESVDVVKDDAYFEANEMKKELTSIEVTITRTGKRHFDLMPIVVGTDNVVRHKDRYSALLLANYMISQAKLAEMDPNLIIQRQYAATKGGWMEDFAK